MLAVTHVIIYIGGHVSGHVTVSGLVYCHICGHISNIFAFMKFFDFLVKFWTLPYDQIQSG